MDKILFLTKPHDYLSQQLADMGFECDHEPVLPKDEVAKIVSDYVGIVINSRFELDGDFLRKAKSLRFIARTGSGVDFVDLAAIEQLNIALLTSPEGNRVAVAEHAMGMLLALMTKLLVADQEMRRGIWDSESNRGHEIRGKTAAIIGFGHNGQVMAKRLAAFECRVLMFDSHYQGAMPEGISKADMATIYREADIVSINIPLTNETLRLVDEAWLAHFSKPIYLINTSRGKVVDTKGLVSMMKKGRVLGAGLDVFEVEGDDFVKAHQAGWDEDMAYLMASKHVVLSPHVAGWTQESHLEHAVVLVRKIKQLLKNKPELKPLI